VRGVTIIVAPLDVLFFCGPDCLFFREDTERIDRVRVLTDADACFTGADNVDVDCGWLSSGAFVLVFELVLNFVDAEIVAESFDFHSFGVTVQSVMTASSTTRNTKISISTG
jgi:hypothetical protein